MIWCVEDDGGIRDIEMYALNSAGFKTRGFEDGRSFWEALKKERPKLIILDVMLPEMDGIELLTRMKESSEWDEIPVIMATAKGQEYNRIRGLELGADDYIVKHAVQYHHGNITLESEQNKGTKISVLFNTSVLI